MTYQTMMLFYVADPMASAEFYSKLLDNQPIEASPGFAMFQLDGGTMLGLWNATGVVPKPVGGAGSSELGLMVNDKTDVTAFYKCWSEADVTIAQTPTTMDFGYTFTALDPDGNRIRVFASA
jgi:predicted enzyme related to lactoylglutathione lyase